MLKTSFQKSQAKTSVSSTNYILNLNFGIMAKRYFEGDLHSKEYAKFRPSPPDDLIKYVISKTKKNDLALDIGCGSGQMTKLLAPFFKKAKKYTPFHLDF